MTSRAVTRRASGHAVGVSTLRQLAGSLELLLSALFEGLGDDRVSSKPFGPRLTQVRVRRGWSLEQLAGVNGHA